MASAETTDRRPELQDSELFRAAVHSMCTKDVGQGSQRPQKLNLGPRRTFHI
jgi:hypothetical protein